ncbi:MAG: precorrin-4 C(11)-methyltransferase [Desulfobacterales bacterium]|jgi:precorrin-4/cobalt-precorrin-4 C11-methyltransferase|nr:precorrin-4 C(11)-methyltransferase [Desulfobacter sp.]MDP6683253.1 precorrin-4 C(11)-methyltransferase [Desulfobacterales bacterium]MDP6808626.1 precorrin-4 C(11)-methyltransferase [Desulfobacterales bacterium]|tara:strand:- start:825 stop:1574 length:750 start_codon:yes stop_codon:yes gene_type:complete
MTVFFVGAGPGDPDLLTRKAERLLRQCRVCVYTGSLVSPAIIDLLPTAAEKHDSAKLSLPQVINIILDTNARDLDVVRLHTGDPSIYSAIGEQISELERHGVDYEVVPGVSAFQAAAAALGWELTVPEIAQSIVLTRTPGRTPMPESESLERFARTGATLCLFLSAHAIGLHAQTLARHYGEDCPVAMVYRASWPDERIIRGTLANIAGKVSSAGITKTALFVVRRNAGEARSRLYDPDFAHSHRKGNV